MAALYAMALPGRTETGANPRAVAAVPAGQGVLAWHFTSDNGTRLRVGVLRADRSRVQAGRNGKWLPSSDKATPIAPPQPVTTSAAKQEDEANELRIRTEARMRHIQRQPLRLSLERLDAGNPLPMREELKPLGLAPTQCVQLLSSGTGERIYAGVLRSQISGDERRCVNGNHANAMPFAGKGDDYRSGGRPKR